MKKLALGLLLLGLGTVAWRSMRKEAPDPTLLFDRFWVDHAPRDFREQYLALFVNSQHAVGHFSIQTMWTGQWEGFHYHLLPRESGVLDVIFPNTNERKRVTYLARACNENGFDYCLDVSGASRGAQRYYSRKEWGRSAGEVTGAQLFPLVDGEHAR